MLKKFNKFNRIQKLSMLTLIMVIFCMLAGTTSAWLINEDALNNHFGVKNHFVDITIREPNWESVGREQAQKMQPGMDIFKDPRAQNLSDENCYIRMKFEIVDSNGDAVTGDKLNVILNAIKYYNSDDTFTDYPALNSSDFTKSGDWYYYTRNGLCIAVEPFETTTPLFTDVIIPVLKKDYQYFNESFSIVVKAEAVFSSGIESSSATVETVKARFDSVAGEDSTSETTQLALQRVSQRYVSNQQIESGSAIAVGKFGEVQ